MTGSFLIAAGFFVAGKMGVSIAPHISLVITVAATTLVWLIVTYLTPPTEHATLISFYRLARPAGPGWRSIREESGAGSSPDSLPQSLLGWMLGCVFVYSALFGAGSFLHGKMAQGAVWLLLLIVSGAGLLRLLAQLWNEPPPARSEAAGPV
jgi:hypothetical protein